jgi:hypothetical protein
MKRSNKDLLQELAALREDYAFLQKNLETMRKDRDSESYEKNKWYKRAMYAESFLERVRAGVEMLSGYIGTPVVSNQKE